jgi:hypothetical protein
LSAFAQLFSGNAADAHKALKYLLEYPTSQPRGDQYRAYATAVSSVVDVGDAKVNPFSKNH